MLETTLLTSSTSLLIFLTSFLHVSSGFVCTSGNRTTYLRSEGYELQSGSRKNIGSLSLMECSQKCTDNLDDRNEFFSCSSYEYTRNSKSCVLKDESAQPFGPGLLTPAPAPTSIAFFQKICIPSPQLCDAPFSYERVPMHVLVGFALEVVPTPNLSECLRSCIESVQTFRIECKSVMFYHDTKECILNREDRRNRPDLFTSDTQGYIVDYFDNNCAGTQCFAPEVRQYVKVADSVLENQQDITLTNIDFNTCQHFCNVNQNGKGDLFPCKAFMYEEGSQTCYLSDEQSLPRGREDLVSTSGLDYYEKICLTSDQTCGFMSAFQRVPQHVLVGFAKEVMEAPSLGECLDNCLSSSRNNGYTCHSVMYFYETSECLLNTETRRSMPQLFSRETRDFRVDYFDNNCLTSPSLCPDNHQRIYVRVENGELPGHDSSGLQQYLTPMECLQRCTTESRFVCRSVDFNTNGCSWSYQDSSLMQINREPITPTVYYEARCVKDASACGNRYYALDLKPGYEYVGYTQSTVSGISVSECISMCIQNTAIVKCLSVNYDRLSSTCQFNSENCRTKGSGGLRTASNIDYYESQCISNTIGCNYEAVESDQHQSSLYQLRKLTSSNLKNCQTSCDQENAFICRSLAYAHSTGACLLSDDDRSKPPKYFLQGATGFNYYEKANCAAPSVNIECRYDGARIKVNFDETKSGTIFVKNRFSTCREEFHTSTMAVLSLPFPTRNSGGSNRYGSSSGGSSRYSEDNSVTEDSRDCGGTEISRGVYSYMIVVQTNPYHVPGLVTQEDQMFNATCDYSASPDTSLTINNNQYVTGDPPTTRMYAHQGISMDHMRMLILRNGAPVSRVLLGEELDLKWQLVGGPKPLGYFIRECHAERLGGNPPQPDPVKLIHNGCPEPAAERDLITSEIVKLSDGYKTTMVMFRFDGSKSVKLRCTVDYCAKECRPVNCKIRSQVLPSYGRKKRQSWSFNPSVKNVEVARRPLDEFVPSLSNFTSHNDDPLHRNDNSIMDHENNIFNSNFDGEEHEPIPGGEISGVFTIVERLETGVARKESRDEARIHGHNIVHWDEDGLKRHSNNPYDSWRGKGKPAPVIFQDGNVCIVRPLFIGLFTFLSLFCFAEGTVVFVFCWNKYCGGEVGEGEGGRGEGTDWDSAYPSSTNGTTTFRGRKLFLQPAYPTGTTIMDSGSEEYEQRRTVSDESRGSAQSPIQPYSSPRKPARSRHESDRKVRSRAKSSPPVGDKRKQDKRRSSKQDIVLEREESMEEDGNSTTDSRTRLTKAKAGRNYPERGRGKSVPPKLKSPHLHHRINNVIHHDQLSCESEPLSSPNNEFQIRAETYLPSSQPLIPPKPNKKRPQGPPPPPKFHRLSADNIRQLQSGSQLTQYPDDVQPEEVSSSEDTLDGVKYHSSEGDEHTPAAKSGKHVKFPPSVPNRAQPEYRTESLDIQQEESGPDLAQRGYRSRDYRSRVQMGILAEEIQRKILL